MLIPQDIADTIIDPQAYADGERIDHAFSWLRENSPLAKAQPAGFDPFWVVTRHADILAVERQNELFHNGDRSTVLTTIEADKAVPALQRVIEEAEFVIARQRRQPQRQLGEVGRHRVAVNAINAALRHQAAGMKLVVLILRDGGL